MSDNISIKELCELVVDRSTKLIEGASMLQTKAKCMSMKNGDTETDTGDLSAEFDQVIKHGDEVVNRIKDMKCAIHDLDKPFKQLRTTSGRSARDSGFSSTDSKVLDLAEGGIEHDEVLDARPTGTLEIIGSGLISQCSDANKDDSEA